MKIQPALVHGHTDGGPADGRHVGGDVVDVDVLIKPNDCLFQEAVQNPFYQKMLPLASATTH